MQNGEPSAAAGEAPAAAITPTAIKPHEDLRMVLSVHGFGRSELCQQTAIVAPDQFTFASSGNFDRVSRFDGGNEIGVVGDAVGIYRASWQKLPTNP
jgi:hypothetical protein